MSHSINITTYSTAISVDEFSECKKFLFFGLLPFRTHNQTRPIKNKKSLPNPIQPNPWVDPTHEQLCGE